MKFSRMVSAMAPVSPLLPSRFHIAELNNLAVLNQMLHQVVVSAKQRFRLKLRIIATGVKITSGYLLTRIHRVLDRRSSTEHEWEEIVNAGQDFQQLTTESVESFKNLMGALPSGLASQLAENLRMRTSSPPCHQHQPNPADCRHAQLYPQAPVADPPSAPRCCHAWSFHSSIWFPGDLFKSCWGKELRRPMSSNSVASSDSISQF